MGAAVFRTRQARTQSSFHRIDDTRHVELPGVLPDHGGWRRSSSVRTVEVLEREVGVAAPAIPGFGTEIGGSPPGFLSAAPSRQCVDIYGKVPSPIRASSTAKRSGDGMRGTEQNREKLLGKVRKCWRREWDSNPR